MTNVKVLTYTFTPASTNFGNTLLSLPDYSPVVVARLVRVYNITRGKLIYDTSASTGSASASGTTVTLTGGPNTSKMQSTDSLEIVYDDGSVASGGGGGGGGTVTAAATGLPVKPGTDGFAVTATAAPEGLPVQAGSNGLSVTAAASGLPVKAGSGGLAVSPAAADGLPIQNGTNPLVVTGASAGVPVRTGTGGLAVSSAAPEGVAVQAGVNGLVVTAAAAGIPIQAGSAGLNVTSNGERAFLRDDFPGTGLDATKWDITLGTGASQSVANSILTLNSGTTAGAITTLRSKTTFLLPARLYATLMLSQRIVNCDVYLEFVNAAGDTRVSWYFTGTSATGATALSTNNGIKADADTALSITNSAVYTAFELDGDDTGWDWNERTLASSSQASLRHVRSRTVPGGGEPLYAQIRIVNGATAPASSTAVTVESIVAHSSTRLPVEITRGRGISGANDSVPVVINNQPTLGTNSNTGLRVVSAEYAETTTALAANASSGGTTRDFGTDTNSRPTRLRWTYSATAAALGSIAHVVLEESIDSTTWRETQRSPVPNDGQHHTGEWSAGHFRYARIRVLNGATAQTALTFYGLAVRGDGSTADTKANMPFPLTPLTGTTFAASAVFLGPALNLGPNHAWERARLQIRNNDTAATTYTYALQISNDGTNWYPALNAGGNPVTATSTSATPASFGLEALIGGWQYIRAAITNNSATAGAAAHIAHMSLVSL